MKDDETVAQANETAQGFKIEKGVPLPQARSRRKYPFDVMEVGDSVFLPGMSGAQVSGPIGYLRPKKFVYRKADGGVRVWRIV